MGCGGTFGRVLGGFGGLGRALVPDGVSGIVSVAIEVRKPGASDAGRRRVTDCCASSVGRACGRRARPTAAAEVRQRFEERVRPEGGRQLWPPRTQKQTFHIARTIVRRGQCGDIQAVGSMKAISAAIQHSTVIRG